MFHRISYGQTCSSSADRAWVKSKSVNKKPEMKLYIKDIILRICRFACHINISIFNKKIFTLGCSGSSVAGEM